MPLSRSKEHVTLAFPPQIGHGNTVSNFGRSLRVGAFAADFFFAIATGHYSAAVEVHGSYFTCTWQGDELLRTLHRRKEGSSYTCLGRFGVPTATHEAPVDITGGSGELRLPQ